MTGMAHRITGALLMLGAITLVNAQQHELGLTLGRLTGFGRGGIEIGSGVAFQANYGYRFATTRHAAFLGEVHLLANPQREIASANTLATRDIAALYAVPGLRVKLLPARGASPYFAFGAGYALYEQSQYRLDGQPNNAPRFTHRGTIGFGGGVDFKLWRFVGGRIEVRDFYSGSPSFNTPFSGGGQHNLVAGGGFVLKFGRAEE